MQEFQISHRAPDIKLGAFEVLLAAETIQVLISDPVDQSREGVQVDTVKLDLCGIRVIESRGEEGEVVAEECSMDTEFMIIVVVIVVVSCELVSRERFEDNLTVVEEYLGTVRIALELLRAHRLCMLSRTYMKLGFARGASCAGIMLAGLVVALCGCG